ncbi:MAG TPA: hypothetical protein ENF38_01720, partial [Candidatus Aenigmarchaeota archaeon]|nr:hypothetical protein [Candidatus Aenigmarchaeota archaeon]
MLLMYIRKAIVIVTLVLLVSCMPWTSKFNCPKPPLGKCQSIEKTYRETDNQQSYQNVETLNVLLEKLKKCKPHDNKCRENITEKIKNIFAQKENELKEIAGEYNKA